MENRKQYYENVAITIIKNLEKRQMSGFYCADSAKTPEEQKKIYGEICCSDFFLMSKNVITLGEELGY